MIFAWISTYPLHLQSEGGYLYDSTSPLFWIGLSLANAAIFLIASGSRSRLERFACAFAFIVLTYSPKYFFTSLEGVDSDLFRGLIEGFPTHQAPQVYYRWPLLFILGTGFSEVTGQGLHVAMGILFLAWNLIFAGGLFFYTNERNDTMDFLAPMAYIIAAYPFIVWQFSAQTFALALSAVCIILLSREGAQTQHTFRAVTFVLYAAIVLSHSFFGIFLALAVCVMALRDQKYLTFALAMVTMFSLGLFVNLDWIVPAVLSEYARIYGEYYAVSAVVLTTPVSTLDALGQIVSRALTLSVWGLMVVATVYSILSKRIRRVDVSLVVSGSLYAVVGFYGWRAIQILLIPTMQAIKSLVMKKRIQKVAMTYFFLAIVIFPFVIIHRYYNDTGYMTLAEQHAVDAVLLATYGGRVDPDFRMMLRERTRAYVWSKALIDVNYVNEWQRSGILKGSHSFGLIFMSPEFEKDLLAASLSRQELSGFEQGTQGFSRVYSNGQVTVFLNVNATSSSGG
jgi:hypothetical protein